MRCYVHGADHINHLINTAFIQLTRMRTIREARPRYNGQAEAYRRNIQNAVNIYEAANTKFYQYKLKRRQFNLPSITRETTIINWRLSNLMQALVKHIHSSYRKQRDLGAVQTKIRSTRKRKRSHAIPKRTRPA